MQRSPDPRIAPANRLTVRGKECGDDAARRSVLAGFLKQAADALHGPFRMPHYAEGSSGHHYDRAPVGLRELLGEAIIRSIGAAALGGARHLLPSIRPPLSQFDAMLEGIATLINQDIAARSGEEHHDD